MKRILYPTRLQLETLCRWDWHGSDALCSDERDAHGRDMVRVRHMRRLRELMVRMSLDVRYLERFNRSAHVRTVALDRLVLEELLTVARINGYITDYRGMGEVRVTPLDARALHIVRLLADGVSTRQCAQLAHIQRFSVYSAIDRAKTELGVRSIPHLIGEVYRRGYLPAYEERLSILAGRGGPLPMGYLEVDVDDIT